MHRPRGGWGKAPNGRERKQTIEALAGSNKSRLKHTGYGARCGMLDACVLVLSAKPPIARRALIAVIDFKRPHPAFPDPHCQTI